MADEKQQVKKENYPLNAVFLRSGKPIGNSKDADNTF
jgi:hypothetical protein